MKRYRAAAVLFAVGLTFGAASCGSSGNGAEEKETFGQKQEIADMMETAQLESGSEEAGNEAEGGGYSVVTGGYRFLLPENLSATVNDEGLILTDEDMNYQMLMTVREYNFEERKADKESLAENVRAAGYEITRDVEIASAGGREYAYFNYVDADGSNMLLAYSYADEEHTFANLVLRYGDLSDEEILAEVSEVLETAEQTDLPDTTLEDIAGANAGKNGTIPEDVSDYASAVESVSLKLGETSVTLAVPETFYIMDFSKEEESSYGKSFVSTDGKVEVFLTGAEECYDDSVEAWVKNDISIPDSGDNIAKSEVQSEQVGEVVVSYQMGSYEMVSSYSGKSFTCLVLEAVGELPEGGYIEVQAESTEEEGLNFDMVRGFFETVEE